MERNKKKTVVDEVQTDTLPEPPPTAVENSAVLTSGDLQAAYQRGRCAGVYQMACFYIICFMLAITLGRIFDHD